MLRTCLIAFVLLFSNRLCAVAQIGTAPDRQSQLKAEIEQVLKTVQALKPGMTRQDVLQSFTTEGGISSRTWNHYVYKLCPYIKIDVTFDTPAGSPEELPGDRIVSISKPYLQYSIYD